MNMTQEELRRQREKERKRQNDDSVEIITDLIESAMDITDAFSDSGD
jgi:hypothetical protein